ncbi:nucleoside deaminase [Litchfieldella rifensis]|uniref:Nucleoside deaminase n=1 Tax=Litchfieldella rifensis TaxID=762643 RepID=A0ABV7LJC0_9GAMM
MTNLTETELQHLRTCFDIARAAKQRGDTPFGACLVDQNGKVLLEAGNATVTNQDVTAHAESEVVRAASKHYSPDELDKMTLFSSAEPCAMCAGAIAWSGIGRVVYALGSKRVEQLDQPEPHIPTVSGRTIMETAKGAPVVIGPVLEDEAAAVFSD